jgi:hypothetical protein
VASTYTNKEFWKGLIEMYRGLPAFWKIRSDLHKNRKLTSERHDKLIAKLKETQLIADRDIVWRKVNTLQTNYRREVKKIKETEEDLVPVWMMCTCLPYGT